MTQDRESVMPARKISFEEARETSTVFLMDEELERELEERLEELMRSAATPLLEGSGTIDVPTVLEFLHSSPNALEVILRNLDLPMERFQRLVSLLRRLGRISDGSDSEWGIRAIQSRINSDAEVARILAELLVHGHADSELATHVPRLYLRRLNCAQYLGVGSMERRLTYEKSLVGTRGGRMGYKVERRIESVLQRLGDLYGLSYGRGRWGVLDTDIDLAVPSPEDPWVVIMSSFQETTSSGQTNKVRDMRRMYQRICDYNSRNRQNRAFVNFVDGGGWLARKSDMRRLWDECDYYLNLHYLEMLESIILERVPERFRQTGPR